MSPNEYDQIRDRLEPALKKLGWMCRERKQHHDRDWDRSWTEVGWLNGDGVWLIDESDVPVTLAEELIRLASLLP